MHYLSAWAICFGDHTAVNRDNWPMGIAFKPTFLCDTPIETLVGVIGGNTAFLQPGNDTDEAFAIFWYVGSKECTNTEFAKEEIPQFKDRPTIIFDGTATYQDGKVIFKGRGMEPFIHVTRALFLLVPEQIAESDVEDWEFVPCKFEREENTDLQRRFLE